MDLRIETDFSVRPKSPATPKRQIFHPEGSEDAYEGIRQLGDGGFGVVWSAFTPRKVHKVAMKIPFLERGSREVDMLKLVQGAPHVLQYRGDFKLSERYSIDEHGDLSVLGGDTHSHAILTDVLPAPDTYEMFIKKLSPGDVTKLSSAQIFEIGKQGLEALEDFELRNLVHRDLKPENLSYNELSKELTIFDFGGAQTIDKLDPNEVEGTLSYRAPEQMLYMRYGASVDIWSLGLTLFELYTGYPLIAIEGSEDFAQTTVDYLHVVTQNLGPLPAEFIKGGKQFFKKDGSIAYRPSEKVKQNLKYFSLIEKRYQKAFGYKMLWQTRLCYAVGRKGETLAEAKEFIAFLEPMLRYTNRITPKEALEKFERREEVSLRRNGCSQSPSRVASECLATCIPKHISDSRNGMTRSLKDRVLSLSELKK
jgi:serine/threonine protein kinase